MKIILIGASGMVGQGILRECLLDDGVQKVLSIARSAIGCVHAKFTGARLVVAIAEAIADTGAVGDVLNRNTRAR